MSLDSLLQGADTEATHHDAATHAVARRLLTASLWQELAASPQAGLLALWADQARCHALYRTAHGILPVATPIEGGRFPALSPFRPAAAWQERAIRDLWGYEAEHGVDSRPWLDHGRWPMSAPLSPRPGPPLPPPEQAEWRMTSPFASSFVSSRPDIALHERSIGPVHPLMREPAQLRLHLHGTLIRQAEWRLGYTHRGIQWLMRGKPLRDAIRIAARITGDAALAHGLAFARAAEAALRLEPPPRALLLRGLMNELERCAVHLHVLAATASAAGADTYAAKLSAWRERLLRAIQEAFGNRMMIDLLIPGGVLTDLLDGTALETVLQALARTMPELIEGYETAASLSGHGLCACLRGCAVLSGSDAVSLAVPGPAGRASGRPHDLRTTWQQAPHGTVHRLVLANGDADARMRVRLAEIQESLRLALLFLESLPVGPIANPMPIGTGNASGEGYGGVESARGACWHWLRIEGGMVVSAHAADPSWRLIPAIEAALPGTDIDLLGVALASFALSPAGADL
ncbi:hydrogenase large subunit [Granulibacter bethesdensis]|uniref:hydrogenase large subunit n=1 Tax=Granulibacter bethesdensis TaxID=364410 RepID=UPI0003F1E318|nr:nickel-dependent hydrogenase large subunit [Granulibacter bethesdensis]AHJ69593.1 Formate hydrogenlyase subunit 5 [Granulibacter bethesdensis]